MGWVIDTDQPNKGEIMECIVRFKDGYVCVMELIYNWDRLHMYRTDDAYLLVPYQDVEIGKISVEEFARCQKAAKELPIPKAPRPIVWKEVKTCDTSS